MKKTLKKLLGITPPPDDFVGYPNLIAFIRRRGLSRLEGDIVEIGAFMGGGTVQLAKYARKYGKKVFVIDIFEPGLDTTVSESGVTATDVYRAYLNGRQMIDVYQEAIGGFDNVITLREDSMKVKFPEEQKFIFGFVDGCHQKAYIENDFGIIWPNLVSGGVLGCHDYRYDDWPEVTPAVEGLIEQYQNEISEVHQIVGSYGITSVLLVKK